jgi:hypothetical protein
MEIAKYDQPRSISPSCFCLRLQGGSVFADFDVDWNGQVHLLLISFDGYGCCSTVGEVTKMSAVESQTLVWLVNSDDVNRDEVREILYRYFDQNQNVIWRDALEAHDLLK